jgi:hypothetical protein
MSALAARNFSTCASWREAIDLLLDAHRGLLLGGDLAAVPPEMSRRERHRSRDRRAHHEQELARRGLAPLLANRE